MNIFKLAEIQLNREGKDSQEDLLNRAITIRKWLDDHSQRLAEKILQGGKVYRYGNKIKVI